MGTTTSILSIVFTIFLLLHFTIPAHSSTREHASSGNVPAMFIYGDSLVDGGNNRYVNGSTAYVDFFPYGVDSFEGSTGRYTNNRTIADIIGEYFGLPILPVSMHPNTTGEAIRYGVNFASAGSGLLNDTFYYDKVIPVFDQILNFENVILPQYASQFNDSNQLATFLDKSVFLFNTAGNDIGWTCFSITDTSMKCNLTEFLPYLQSLYVENLKWLYNLGARKFVVMSVENLGCTPLARYKNDGSCIDTYNEAASMFNVLIKSMVTELNTELSDATIVYINNYAPLTALIDYPEAYGFEVSTRPCCNCTESSGLAFCIEEGSVCPDRSLFVYFDGGHPSDATNVILARKAYYSTNLTEVYPFNLKTLESLTTNTTTIPNRVLQLRTSIRVENIARA